MNEAAETEIIPDLAQRLPLVGRDMAKFQPVGLNCSEPVDGFETDRRATDNGRHQQKGEANSDNLQLPDFDFGFRFRRSNHVTPVGVLLAWDGSPLSGPRANPEQMDSFATTNLRLKGGLPERPRTPPLRKGSGHYGDFPGDPAIRPVPRIHGR